MSKNPIPFNEQERLSSLRNYQILDSEPELQFDQLTQLASKICNAPICLISLIDSDRQWFKSNYGLGEATETPRELSFCQYAILDTKTMIVADPLTDERFKANPSVTGNPNIRFYAGAPIVDDDGYALGTLCVVDNKPNELNDFQLDALSTLAKTVMQLIKYRAVISKKNTYVKFFDDSIDMFGIANEKGELLDVNNAFFQKLEYSKEDIMSIPFKNHVHPLDMDIYKEAFFTTTAKLNFQDTVFRIKSKSGIQYWISWKANFDPLSKQFYIIGRDVSNEIRNIEKLENELKAINNAVIRVELSPEGQILKMNKGFELLLEIDAADLVNKNHTEVLFDEDKKSETHLKLCEELAKGNVQKGIFRRKGKNNKEVWVKGSYMPVINDNGKIEKIIKIAYDISENINLENSLKEAIEVAKKASQSKDIFLANISHDIRTPLNAISGFTHLLSEEELSTENKNYVEAISLASKNLLLLINDVLDISKFESDKIELENKPFNFKQLINEIILINSKTVKAKGLKFLSSVDADIPNWVVADQARLFQILSNILGNALKFTIEGFVKFEVYVNSIKVNKTNITFTISDSGVGIDESNFLNVFERFSQENNDTQRNFAGSGLGLSIVKMLVELYEGTIEVKSKKGEGSTFVFNCSFTISDASHKPTAINKSETKDALKGLKVLIAEDNEHNQILAKALIKKNQGLPTIVENGQEAVDILQNENFDCILMDLQMPIKNGFDATVIIREQLNSNIPIIACTAHSLVGEKTKAMEVGMNDYITKPYSEFELISAIQNHTKHQNSSPTPSLEIEETATTIASVLNKFEEVEGRDFLIQMLAIFKKRIPEDITELKKAFVENDISTVRSKAHLIAGSLSSFMLMEGNKLAIDLENECNTSNVTLISSKSNELIQYLESVLNYIDQHYQVN